MTLNSLVDAAALFVAVGSAHSAAVWAGLWGAYMQRLRLDVKDPGRQTT